MPGLIRGLATGGAIGLLWAVIEGLVAGSVLAIPSTAFALIACGFAGGVLSESVPIERIEQWPWGRVVGTITAGGMVWFVAQWCFNFLLTHSFDLLDEVAAVFSMIVFGACALGVGWVLWAQERWPERAGRRAALVPGSAAVALALFASQITSFIIGFEGLTLLCGGGACCLGAWSLRVGSAGTWIDHRERLVGACLVLVISFGGGLLHYATDDGARDAAWSRVPLTRNLAFSLATMLDGDVDGIGQGYGHPDCDDVSPNVYPGAREIPGNGRDDNCMAGDVSKEEILALWRGDAAQRGQQTAEIPFERKPYNILFVTLDAVRADHTSLHGYEKPTTPTLVELGERSLVFESAWSASNFTAISMMSLFTGLYPTAYVDRETIISREKLTLPSQLREAGYITEAIVDLHPPLPHIYEGFLELDDTLGVRATAAVRNRSSGSTARELSRLARQALKRLIAQ